MKIFAVAIIVVFVMVTAFAAAGEARPEFTGYNYVKQNDAERVASVTAFMESVKGSGIVIKESPEYYSNKLDEFYKDSPESMNKSYFVVLKTIMISEDDWNYHGDTKDHAR